MCHALRGWMVLVSLVLAARPALAGEYYLSDERLGTRIAPLLLLTRGDVQADLRLTTEQVANAARAIDALYTRAESLRGRGNGPEAVAARRAIDDEQRQWLVTNLTAAQQARLTQIDLQWEGASALISRVSVAEAVAVTPDQARELKALLARNPGTPRESQRKLGAHALTLLTPEQRARWRALMGPPIAFQSASQGEPTSSRR